MNRDIFEASFESGKKNITAPPATELLSDPSQAEQFWPEELAKNPEFTAQLEVRHQLNQRLDDVLSRLSSPDMPLEEAIVNHELSEKQVADLYESLSILLNDDDYKRAALYVPFEFLLPADWEPGSVEIAD